MTDTSAKRLVLFDGVCNLCNTFVLFVIDRDPQEQFVFAPLSSEIGQRTLREHKLDSDALESVVLVEGDKVSTHSAAALSILRRLSGLWPLMSVFIILPRFLRDAVYRFIAARRYAWFGRSDQCRVPTPELRRRFVG